MENGRGGWSPAFLDARRYQSRESALRGCAALLAALGWSAGGARRSDSAAAPYYGQWLDRRSQGPATDPAIRSPERGSGQGAGRRGRAVEPAPERHHAGSIPVSQRPLPAKILFLDQGL